MPSSNRPESLDLAADAVEQSTDKNAYIVVANKRGYSDALKHSAGKPAPLMML